MIEHEMERLGKILAADHGIEVACRGSLAYASRRAITLPAIEHFSYLGADAERMLHGLLDHETGHAVDTDFDVVENLGNAIQDAPEDNRAKFRKKLLNALEDGYIEDRRALLYKGCAHNLERKNTWWWTRPDPRLPEARQTIEQLMGSDAKPLSLLLQAATLAVRSHGGQSIETLTRINPNLGALLAPVAGDLAEVGTLAGKTKQTQRCLDIADRIIEKLALDDDEILTALDHMGAPSPEAAVLFEISEQLRKGDDDRPYMVFSHEYDVEQDWADASPQRGMRSEEAHVHGAADALTTVFEAGLRARRDKHRVAGWDEGEIAPELLAEWSAGGIPSDEIYEQMIALDDRAVAVGVLLDCSGSMEGSPATLARRTAIAMHRALATCQLPHEITGFATLYSPQVDGDEPTYPRHHWVGDRASEIQQTFACARQHLMEAHARGVDVRSFARIIATEGEQEQEGAWTPERAVLCVPIYGIFKTFGSDDPRNLMNVSGTTANLDGEAVMWQARRLALRPEPRRVMFVLSDGLPSGSRSQAQGARYLQESIKRCIDAGIEIYGIGMESTYVREFFPVSWVAHSMEELTEVALSALSDALVTGRQERTDVRL
ncbi:MAG: hypothetical protein M3Q55_11810 [Acidobacteriota bacterium]|nr:hypothetical protein [Acidobacteriota bacterium]